LDYFNNYVDSGIADHLCQAKRAAIADTVDSLCAKFRPKMRAGWVAYIKKTNAAGQAKQGPSAGLGKLVVDDD
jgi:hypothetical protein